MHQRQRHTSEAEACIRGRGMHQRQRDTSEADGGGWSRQNLSEVDRLIRMCWRRAEQSECQNVLQVDKASEAEGCIRGSRMHLRSMEVDRADRAGGEQSINTSEAVRVVRTCQNLSGQCKGNLTILRRILYLDLAKGNPK
jgi:hypothetical protein